MIMTDESPDVDVTTDDGDELSDRERKLMKRYSKGIKDYRLHEIADAYIDRNGNGTNLNLLVGGTIVCGKVCSAAEWAEACGAAAERSTGTRSSLFDEWKDEYAHDSDARIAAVEKPENERTEQDTDAFWIYSNFVYLLDAYVLTQTGSMIPTKGQPYRVRASQIQAWGFGTLTPGQPQG